jgi:hypothetical protein
MWPVETFEMGCLVNPSLAKARQNAEAIFTTRVGFIYGYMITVVLVCTMVASTYGLCIQPQTHTDYTTDCNTDKIIFYFM